MDLAGRVQKDTPGPASGGERKRKTGAFVHERLIHWLAGTGMDPQRPETIVVRALRTTDQYRQSLLIRCWQPLLIGPPTLAG